MSPESLPERVEREAAESAYLREQHLGDPAYDGLESPRRIRLQQERDREQDRYDR